VATRPGPSGVLWFFLSLAGQMSALMEWVRSAGVKEGWHPVVRQVVACMDVNAWGPPVDLALEASRPLSPVLPTPTTLALGLQVRSPRRGSIHRGAHAAPRVCVPCVAQHPGDRGAVGRQQRRASCRGPCRAGGPGEGQGKGWCPRPLRWHGGSCGVCPHRQGCCRLSGAVCTACSHEHHP
jgi:hypothetical protein